MSNKSYSDDSIQILEGLDPVRKRPGMYIGSTDSKGLHHLVWEIVDNAVDEALNGYGNSVEISLHTDGSIEVRDHGRGVPCGKHPSGKNTMEVIYGILHAGGKFQEDGAYKLAGGLHGVGGSVVNALSKKMVITSYRDSKISQITFTDGGSKVSKVKNLGKTNETGTLVQFYPDPTIFSTIDFKFDLICERVRETAFLINGLKFTITDEKTDKCKEYKFDNGINAFLEYIDDSKGIAKNIYIESKNNSENIEVRVGLKFTSSYSEKIYSFVNLVKTPDGGSHETGFKNALTRAFNEYGKQTGLLKNTKLEGSDIREGLIGIISVSVPEGILQFEGQTKGKLGTPQARAIVENAVYDYLKFYLQENSKESEVILSKMIKAAQVREASRKVRDDARGKNKEKIERILSGKLAPARNKTSKSKELFLVEGDSAGGSAKQGRDSSFQAILPLRGKVLNTERSSLNDVLKNEELNTIIHCIGAGYSNDFNVKNIQYDKVIIMTDADTDGAHIQCLLLTFFYRYMRPLIEAGHVYIALPPLYKLTKGNEYEYIFNEDDLLKKKKQLSKYNIQRFKGLGEMNATQLWDTTMNPNSRTIVRVNIEDAVKAEKRVQVLMGDKSDVRKEWINANVSFIPDDVEIISKHK